MPISKEVTYPDVGTIKWWQIYEVRNVRQKEPSFSAAKGNLFIQMAGYRDGADLDNAIVLESYRIRYGAQIPEELPDTQADYLVIREDRPSDEDIENCLLSAPRFSGGEIAFDL